eukprot:TRINITY_DN31941_c0_g1_i2.p1 TRINITY_DN31941_c0_g1~~TRINITY_DN31941_c0_g1_i2.p1  ORF type:complete len:730 (+),score=76.08 TRINITY_DN31941_c0_g1_i2:97-2190(+)
MSLLLYVRRMGCDTVAVEVPADARARDVCAALEAAGAPLKPGDELGHAGAPLLMDQELSDAALPPIGSLAADVQSAAWEFLRHIVGAAPATQYSGIRSSEGREAAYRVCGSEWVVTQADLAARSTTLLRSDDTPVDIRPTADAIDVVNCEAMGVVTRERISSRYVLEQLARNTFSSLRLQPLQPPVSSPALREHELYLDGKSRDLCDAAKELRFTVLATKCLAGDTPLHIFLRLGGYRKATCDMLVSPKVAVARNGEGQTVLHLVHGACNPDTVLELLDLGADPHARDSQGALPFHYLVRSFRSCDEIPEQVGTRSERDWTQVNGSGWLPVLRRLAVEGAAEWPGHAPPPLHQPGCRDVLQYITHSNWNCAAARAYAAVIFVALPPEVLRRCAAQRGRRGHTALHHVAGAAWLHCVKLRGEVREQLRALIAACPDSVTALTTRGHTPLHLGLQLCRGARLSTLLELWPESAEMPSGAARFQLSCHRRLWRTFFDEPIQLGFELLLRLQRMGLIDHDDVPAVGPSVPPVEEWDGIRVYPIGRDHEAGRGNVWGTPVAGVQFAATRSRRCVEVPRHRRHPPRLRLGRDLECLVGRPKPDPAPLELVRAASGVVSTKWMFAHLTVYESSGVMSYDPARHKYIEVHFLAPLDGLSVLLAVRGKESGVWTLAGISTVSDGIATFNIRHSLATCGIPAPQART